MRSRYIHFRKDGELIIYHDRIKAHLNIEHTWNDTEGRRGLMFRDHFPSNAGMTFDWVYSCKPVMVMNNVAIPLDMIFISKQGEIKHIEKNIPPHCETEIISPSVAQFVLEVNAGFSDSNDIKCGDYIFFNIPKFRVDERFHQHEKYLVKGKSHE